MVSDRNIKLNLQYDKILTINKSYLVYFFDLRQVFDTLKNTILLQKYIQQNRIRGTTFKVLTAFNLYKCQ